MRPLALALVAGVFAAACGGGETAPSGITGLGELRGRDVGVVSLVDASTLELRYVMQAGYGLEASPAEGDVTLREAPSESLRSLLAEGEIDAALVRGPDAFSMLDDGEFRVVSHVSEEAQALAQSPFLTSALTTYADIAARKREALLETNRLFTEARVYFDTNRSDVIDAVAARAELDAEFVAWWWARHDLLFGDLSEDVEAQLLSLWAVAAEVGDIDAAPELDGLLFSSAQDEDDPPPTIAPEGERVTVSLAVLDHPGRRAALYAIEQGIVTSDSVDLDISYLSQSALMEAASAGQFDVVETSPTAVALGVERGLDLVVLSGALQDRDGTLLFVRN